MFCDKGLTPEVDEFGPEAAIRPLDTIAAAY
jgi:hypothetical protein